MVSLHIRSFYYNMKIKYKCKFCNKECIKLSGLVIHEKTCKLNPNRQLLTNHVCNWPRKKAKEDGWICRGCLKTYRIRRDLFEHQKECFSYKELLKNEAKERGKNFSKKFTGSKILSHPHTDEHKQKMREIAIKRHLGGWHTSKTIKYNGINLDSEYEYKVATELDKNNIKWERPYYLLWEDCSGKQHRYYPDFYLPEYNIYLDPKNDYLINNKSKRFGITDVEKIEKVQEQNNVKILILDKDNLTWQCIKEKR